jgi:hypothetical protein
MKVGLKCGQLLRGHARGAGRILGGFFILFGLPGFALNAEELFVLVGTAEPGEFAGDGEEGALAGGVVGGGITKSTEAPGQGGGEGSGEHGGNGVGGVLGESGGFLGEGADEMAGFLKAEPVLKAAMFPLG